MSFTLKLLALLSVLCGSAWAGNNQGGDRQGQNQQDHGGYGAPEPVTMVGLALGAGAIGASAWRKWRKR